VIFLALLGVVVMFAVKIVAVLLAAPLAGLVALFLACVFSDDWRNLALREMLPRLTAARRIGSPP
jgi:ABC-type phosphate transport system permease subunit